MVICIECGSSVSEVFRHFSTGSIQLSTCHVCGQIADKYVEYDLLLVLLEIMLHKEQAYRHMLFNRLPYMERGVHWEFTKFAASIIFFDAYCKLFLTRQQTAVSEEESLTPRSDEGPSTEVCEFSSYSNMEFSLRYMCSTDAKDLGGSSGDGREEVSSVRADVKGERERSRQLAERVYDLMLSLERFCVPSQTLLWKQMAPVSVSRGYGRENDIHYNQPQSLACLLALSRRRPLPSEVYTRHLPLRCSCHLFHTDHGIEISTPPTSLFLPRGHFTSLNNFVHSTMGLQCADPHNNISHSKILLATAAEFAVYLVALVFWTALFIRYWISPKQYNKITMVKYNYLVGAAVLSMYCKVGTLLMIIWDYEMSLRHLMRLFITTANALGVKVFLNSPTYTAPLCIVVLSLCVKFAFQTMLYCTDPCIPLTLTP